MKTNTTDLRSIEGPRAAWFHGCSSEIKSSKIQKIKAIIVLKIQKVKAMART
jgi:hypothetical protein